MDVPTFQKTLDERAKQDTQASKDKQAQVLANIHTQAIIDTIAQAVVTLMKFQAQHQPKVSVTNQKLPTSIKTPDIQKVVDALEALKQPIQETKPDDTKVVDALNQLNESIGKLPTSFPEAPEPVEEVTVKNQPDYKPDLENITKAISKIDTKPVVNIPKQKEADYTPIIDALTPVVEAIKAIQIPETPQTDLSPLIEATNSVQESIANLRFPTANYVLPFKSSDGKATQVQLDADGNLPISASISGADGAIEDGINPSIRATVIESIANPGTFGLVALESNGADISGSGPITNDGTFAKETGGNLAAIAGKDFATQTTLALIKAKTDNIDVALSTRTKPADQQHTIVDSGTVSATQGTSPWVISGTADPTIPTTVRYGQATVSVTNTAVQLTAGAGVAFVVQALAGNAGNVVIGDASVTTANGFQLQPGQATGIAISNTNKLYVNGTSGDGVCWIGS